MRPLLACSLFGFVILAAIILIYFHGSSSSKKSRGVNNTSEDNGTVINDTLVWQCVSPDKCIDLRSNFPKEQCSEEDPSMILCLLQVDSPLKETTLEESSTAKTSTVAVDDSRILLATPKRVPGQKAQEMCQLYAETAFVTEKSPILSLTSSVSTKPTCDNSKTLIKGGTAAKENEFPHMANIGYIDECNELSWICGGSLVSKSFILSAAHCNITGDDSYALLGRNSLLGDPIEILRNVKRISEVIIHPDYVVGKRFSDIALFKLENEVDISKSIRPICIDTGETLQVKEAIATGWGLDKDLNPMYLLQKVTLDIFDENTCTTKYRDDFNIESKHVVCAGADGKDTCQADSGGPLQMSHKKYQCMYSIIGITSFGPNCNMTLNVPGVYTRVSHYVKWIEDNVWPN